MHDRVRVCCQVEAGLVAGCEVQVLGFGLPRAGGQVDVPVAEAQRFRLEFREYPTCQTGGSVSGRLSADRWASVPGIAGSVTDGPLAVGFCSNERGVQSADQRRQASARHILPMRVRQIPEFDEHSSREGVTVTEGGCIAVGTGEGTATET